MSDGRRATDPIDDLGSSGHTVAQLDATPRLRHADFAVLFDMHYAQIVREHEAVTTPGVLALAFDLGSAELTAKRHAKVRLGAVDAVTIGRHERCELSLPRDRSLSLRHLTLMVHPATPGDDRVRFRLLDLRTQLAFQDCFGNRMQAVEADGPAMIAVSRYAVLLLPTGSFRLPQSALKAWDIVADPLFLEYRTEYMLQTWDPAPRGSAPPQPELPRPQPLPGSLRPSAESMRTSFTVLDGPARPTRMTPGADDAPLGVFEVESAGEVRKLAIDAKTAERGLLIGSYDRCDDPCLTHLTHPAISRVHLLIIGCAGDLYAVDTASSNGTFVETHDGRRVRARVAKLGAGMSLALADSRARLRWTPAG